MEFLFKLLLLPLAHSILKLYMHRFRKNIKNGDVVGVKFGDYVLNRTVYMRLGDNLLTLDYQARVYKEYDVEKAYVRDSKTPVDVSGDLQNLY